MTTTTCTLQLSAEKQKSTEEKFNIAIFETVDESFSSIKNMDKEVIYHQLENSFKIKKKEIPLKIESFADAVEQMFGVAAKLVEIRIIEALHKRFPEFIFLPKESNFDFKEYAVSLRDFLLHAL